MAKKRKKLKKGVRSWMLQASVGIALAIVITNLAFGFVRVSGSSMYPTLQDGNLGLVNLIKGRIGNIKRFDIVIVKFEALDEYIIKRVVGLPGETVEYNATHLYINGEVVEEDFLSEVYTGDTEAVTLGEDEYYCVGDNRTNSMDSRMIGPIKSSEIKGVWMFGNNK